MTSDSSTTKRSSLGSKKVSVKDSAARRAVSSSASKITRALRPDKKYARAKEQLLPHRGRTGDSIVSVKLHVSPEHAWASVSTEGGQAITQTPRRVRSSDQQTVHGNRLKVELNNALSTIPDARRVDLLTDLRASLKMVIDEIDAETRCSPKHDPAPIVSSEEFMTSFRRKFQEQRNEDVRSGRLITSKELAEQLDITPAGVSKALNANRFFAFTLKSGTRYYPSFFADSKYERGKLEEISKALGNLPPDSKWNFFTAARFSLGNKSPLEALSKGRFDDVLKLARGFAEE